MTRIVWDKLDERFFDQGVRHGVLYKGEGGEYVDGVPWNGLTNVTQSPSGAEPNKQYADDIVYVNLLSAEEYAATIECFMAPREFDEYNGVHTTASGLRVSGQNRGVFGFSWKTGRGTAANPNLGYVINIAYGCQASPSEKSNATKSDTPEPVAYSFALSTTPVEVTVDGQSATTAYISIDSTDPNIDPANLAALEDILYGDEVNAPRLPLPDEVDDILSTGVLTDTPAKPAFDGVDEITIPVDPGTNYYEADGTLIPDGAFTIAEDTIVYARPAPGYKFIGTFVDRWLYEVP